MKHIWLSSEEFFIRGEGYQAHDGRFKMFTKNLWRDVKIGLFLVDLRAQVFFTFYSMISIQREHRSYKNGFCSFFSPFFTHALESRRDHPRYHVCRIIQFKLLLGPNSGWLRKDRYPSRSCLIFFIARAWSTLPVNPSLIEMGYQWITILNRSLNWSI